MATVVNARDVILQAALPNGRVAGVTMQPNIVVDPSQVTGLGLIIDGTRLIDFESSAQVFQVNTAGTATPSSITLTVNFRNVTGTPSLTVTSGTLTSTPTLSGGPSVYTATLPYANMSTDAVTIRASVVYNSVTYTDDLTIVKARDGQFAVNAFLTNESHTVPSSDTGVVSSYTGAGGTFKVYQGSNDVTTSATYAVQSNPNSLTTSINATTGVFSVTAGFGTGIDTATVTYRATYGGQTYDKVFTITKSKAGTAGSAGQRGSRTFYVSGISSWSDATATSTASVSGGPVINDVVTQYNSGTGFSQTRFWNGSAWVVVNAVVDGNLLVSGTVGAAAISAGAIRTSHLLVQGGRGQALNNDPTCADSTAWATTGGNAPTFVTVTDGVAGSQAIRCTGNSYFQSRGFPVQPGRKYRVSGYYRRTSAGTGASSAMYFRILPYTASGAGAWTGSEYALRDLATGLTQPYEGFTPSVSSTWTKFSGLWTAPSIAAVGYLDIHAGWDTNVGGVQEFQELRVDEMVDSSLVVLGGLDADRIDTRNLTIKDSSGNVIFSATQNLDINRILNNQRIQNNLCDSTWWSVNVSAPTAAVANGWSINGASTENGFGFATGPRGNTQTVWVCTAGAGGAAVGDADGGFHAPIYGIDRTKTYRFAVPVYRANANGHTNFFGISDVCDLNTTTPNGNPYFKSESAHAVGRWYLMVGYVFPSGSSGATNTGAGIYDLTTGQLLGGGTNWTWQTAATSCTVRAYQYYGVAGAVSYFAQPLVHLVDGTEPSLNEFFNLSNAMMATTDIRLATTGGGMVLAGNSCDRPSNGGAWDGQCYSLDSYTNGASVSFIPSAGTNSYFMAGLNADPTTDASYASIDYAFYMSGTSAIYIYESGSAAAGGASFGTYTTGDRLTVTYDGSNVRYEINGTVVRTVAAPANLKLYFDSSIVYYGLTNIRFGPYGNPSAVAPNNPITSSNVSTYIANAAIQNAQIGNAIYSSNFNGTIDGSGNITADGTTGWAISKSGYAVFNNIKVRGDVQANTVTQGAVTTNASVGYGLTGVSLNSASATSQTQTASFATITAAGGYVFVHAGLELSADCVSTSVVRVGFAVQAKVNGTNVGSSVNTFTAVYAYTSAFGTNRSCRVACPVILSLGQRTGSTVVTFEVVCTWYGTTGPIAAGGANFTSRSDIGAQGYMIETRG